MSAEVFHLSAVRTVYTGTKHAHTTRNTQLTCSHVQLGFKAGGICLLQHRADKVLTQMRHHDWGRPPYAPRGSLGLECMQGAPYAPRSSLREAPWASNACKAPPMLREAPWASNACDSPSNEAVCGAYGGDRHHATPDCARARAHRPPPDNTQHTAHMLTCSCVQLGFKPSVEVGGIYLLQHRADNVLTQMRHHDWGAPP